MKATSPADFGNAWNTGTSECTPDSGIDPCPADSQAKTDAENLCFILEADGKYESTRFH